MIHPIVLACDECYAMPLATTLRSIVEANRGGRPLEFHVMCEGVSDKMRTKVIDSLPRNSASIRWIEVGLDLFSELSTEVHISKVTYARLLIPYIFSNKISRVLYLDADLIVLDNLESLLETNLERNVVGAVLDGLDSRIKYGSVNINIPRVRDYFNAGVLLIDLCRWRKERISEKAMEYLKLHPRSPFSDQDALNVACDGLWKKLDPRWNHLDFYEKKQIGNLIGEERPKIVHFVTSHKPWNASIPNLNAAFYDAFRSRTKFARTLKDKASDLFQSNCFYAKSILKHYAPESVVTGLQTLKGRCQSILF